jgi:putative tricarboxylic transport membrane protein
MTGNWTPQRALTLAAGTPPGGGLDRVARALEKAIVAAGAADVPVAVENVAGDGARRVWTEFVDAHPGDAHVVSISSPNLTTDYLAGLADFEHTRYTPIATLVTEYIAFAVRAESAYESGADLLLRLETEPHLVTVALSTALGNPNHIALAKLLRAPGSDVNAPIVRVFDSALDAVADVMAGQADVCAVTAASLLAEVEARNARLIAISAPARLEGRFADVPTWDELGVPCVVGAWRGVSGPAGISPAQVGFWEEVLRDAVAQPVWVEELARLSWSPMYNAGTALHDYLAAERAEYAELLGELGLLKR